MRIVFASHTARSAVFRIGSHHYSKELAELGHDVSHISTPLSLTHVARLKDLQVRRRFEEALSVNTRYVDGVRQIVPLTAFPVTRAAPAFVEILLKHAYITGGIERIREPDILFLDQPALAPLITLLNPQVSVYRPTDIHTGARLADFERALLPKVNAVIATSEHVLKALGQSAQNIPNLVLENGVDYEHFTSRAIEDATDRSGAVYIGALDERFDWQGLHRLACNHPSENFTLIGPVPSKYPKGLPSNVKLIGPVPYTDLPEHLGRAKVGLLPTNSAPVNVGRSPMKFYEYLAAGLYIVASETPTLAARAAPGVFLYTNGKHSVHMLSKALNQSAPNYEGRLFASTFSWKTRAASLFEFATGLTP